MKVRVACLIGVCSIACMIWSCGGNINELKNLNADLSNQITTLKDELAECKNDLEIYIEAKKALELQCDVLVAEENKNKKSIEELQIKCNSLLQEVVELWKNQISPYSVDCSDTELYEVHPLIQKLDFEYDGYNTKVYSSLNKDFPVYTVSAGDVLMATQFIHVKTSNENWVQVMLSDKKMGYIPVQGNPWKNEQYSYLYTIQVDSKDVTVLKLDDTFTISNKEQLRELPSETSDSLYENHDSLTYFTAMAITADYKWVLMNVEGVTGWVPANSVDKARGGVILCYPEASVLWDLIWSKGI